MSDHFKRLFGALREVEVSYEWASSLLSQTNLIYTVNATQLECKNF